MMMAKVLKTLNNLKMIGKFNKVTTCTIQIWKVKIKAIIKNIKRSLCKTINRTNMKSKNVFIKNQ
jgi:hypothetical protein